MPTKMMTLALLLFAGLLAWAPSAAADEARLSPAALAALEATPALSASEAALDAELHALLSAGRHDDPNFVCPAWQVCLTTFQCAGVCLFGGICLGNCCYCR